MLDFRSVSEQIFLETSHRVEKKRQGVISSVTSFRPPDRAHVFIEPFALLHAKTQVQRARVYRCAFSDRHASLIYSFLIPADDKKYGAFISYHFSTEMDKFAQQQTRDATAATLTSLESLGYRVYDENRDGFPSESEWRISSLCIQFLSIATWPIVNIGCFTSSVAL